MQTCTEPSTDIDVICDEMLLGFNIDVGDEVGTALADNLTENYTLTELNMSGNCAK